MEIVQSWHKWQRQQSAKQSASWSCHLCGESNQPGLKAFREHFIRAHAHLAESPNETDRVKVIEDNFQKSVAKVSDKSPPSSQPLRSSPQRRVSELGAQGNPSSITTPPPPQPPISGSCSEVRSPGRAAEVSSVAPQPDVDSSRAVSPTNSLKRAGSKGLASPRGPRARPTSSTSSPQEVARPKAHKGTLWTPGQEPPPRTHRAAARQSLTGHGSSKGSGPSRPAQPASSHRNRPSHDAQISPLKKQPETRTIGEEQLVPEVKGIYAGLVLVESKCIEVDTFQANNEDPNALNKEQWQALIALHRTLLYEHHDFFLASQHPAASPALKRLASKYAMPARMWRHAIHSFLELLRRRLPVSREHMLTFIYLAYSMMALLYETVPAFEKTWIECLGDLGRYRMAIEDDSMGHREVWTSVSRRWYTMASDKAPATGRLYHHLAILAKPNALQQLFYYTKSLCVPIPFPSARESIMTLFDPLLSGQSAHLPQLDAYFVYAHAVLFKKITNETRPKLQMSMDEFLGGLDINIARNSSRWIESGYFIGIANSCALVSYGDLANPIMRAIKPGKADTDTDESTSVAEEPLMDEFEKSLELTCETQRIVYRRYGDPSVLAFLHVSLVFIFHLSHFPEVMTYVQKRFPWRLLASQLNTLMIALNNTARFEEIDFPRAIKGESPRPLPEDFALRGLIWVEKYLPLDWFVNVQVDEDERYMELPSMMEERRIRALWLGVQIARCERWLLYDYETHQFSVKPEYDEDIDELPLAASPGEEPTTGENTPTTTRSKTAEPLDEPMETDEMRVSP